MITVSLSSVWKCSESTCSSWNGCFARYTNASVAAASQASKDHDGSVSTVRTRSVFAPRFSACCRWTTILVSASSWLQHSIMLLEPKACPDIAWPDVTYTALVVGQLNSLILDVKLFGGASTLDWHLCGFWHGKKILVLSHKPHLQMPGGNQISRSAYVPCTFRL